MKHIKNKFPRKIEIKESIPQVWDIQWGSYNRAIYDYHLVCTERSVSWQNIEQIIRVKYGTFKDLNCIEIGAGSGHYSMLFARRGARVTLLDYSEKALDLSRCIFEDYKIDKQRVNFIKMDALQMDHTFFGRYDVSMSFGVAEHFRAEERSRIIKAHYDVLKKQGIMFVCVPNANCLPYRIYCFIKYYFTKNEEIECIPYSKNEFLAIANKYGVKNRSFLGFSYKETYNPLEFYYRKKGIVRDVSKIKKQKPSFLDKYLGSGIIFCGTNEG